MFLATLNTTTNLIHTKQLQGLFLMKNETKMFYLKMLTLRDVEAREFVALESATKTTQILSTPKTLT